MNLTPLRQYGNGTFMYQPQLEVHDPDPPLAIGETISADVADVYLNLTVYAEEEFPVVTLRLTPSYTEEYTRVDAAEVYLDLTPTGTDIFAPLIPWWDPPPTASNKWFQVEGNKWSQTAQTRFVLTVRGRAAG